MNLRSLSDRSQQFLCISSHLFFYPQTAIAIDSHFRVQLELISSCFKNEKLRKANEFVVNVLQFTILYKI